MSFESKQLASVDQINKLIEFNKSVEIFRTPEFRENDISDGYHTFDELYEFRKYYNAIAFNALAKARPGLCDTGRLYKSFRHSDGQECFGGGWFIVVLITAEGKQITNHYKKADWDLFRIPSVHKPAHEYDGHTPQDVLGYLRKLATAKI